MVEFTLLLLVMAIGFHMNYGCTFPEKYRHNWIKNGFNGLVSVSITHNAMSFTDGQAQCVKEAKVSEGSHYFLLVDQSSGDENDGGGVLYRCVLLIDRHDNLIQYKEGGLNNPETIETDEQFKLLCNGAFNPTLHTLVKENAVPISCPDYLNGPLMFSYNKGSGYCGGDNDIQQKSVLDQCASPTKLHLNFKECSMLGYNRMEMRLQCLAMWSSGDQWIYAKYGSHGSHSYRCMKYKSVEGQLQMALSSDATCTGMASFGASPIALKLDKGRATDHTALCHYPSWFTDRVWTDLEGEFEYSFDHEKDELISMKRTNRHGLNEEISQRLVCHRESRETINLVTFISQVTNECKTGYRCTQFQLRSDNVMVLTQGALAKSAEKACNNAKMNPTKADTRLLIDNELSSTACPLVGVYSLQRTGSRCSSTIEMGCSEASSVTIKKCDTSGTELMCRAAWREGADNHLIISTKSHPMKGNCYKYIEGEDKILSIDQKGCNFAAPTVLDSSLPHPPFRLSTATAACPRGAISPSNGYSSSKNLVQDYGGSGSSIRLSDILLLVCSVLVIQLWM